MTRLSKALAEKAHAAIIAHYRAYLEPYDYGDGRTTPGDPPPVLVENYMDTGHWGITWEEGPDEWAYRAFTGGFSEELYTLAYPDALAVARNDKGLAGEDAERWAAERAREIATDKGAVCPAGVQASPYYSFSLVLYPA